MPEAASPAGGAGMPTPQPTQQPPMGVSSATQPTPNKGYEAAAAQQVSVVLKMLTEIMSMSGAASELGQAANKSISILAKLVPPGTTSQAGQRNAIDKMQMQNAQQQQTMKQLNPAMGGGQAAGMQQQPRAA